MTHPFSLLTSAFFYWKAATFSIPKNTDVDCILISNVQFFQLFLSLLKVALITMLAKLATLGLLKIQVLWITGYDLIVSTHDVRNKILSCNSNYIVDAVKWPKFGNSSVSMREVIITSIFWGVNQKKSIFLAGYSWFELNNWL